MCERYATRHSTLTQLAQKFCACPASEDDRKRRIRQSHELGPRLVRSLEKKDKSKITFES